MSGARRFIATIRQSKAPLLYLIAVRRTAGRREKVYRDD